MGAWFTGIVRGLFAAIDKVIVWAMETLYSLIFEISSVQLFDNTVLKDFASRISVLLTIFMLFKLSFSFLTYIINPDQMSDKAKGTGKLIQNVVVTLALLVSYQFVFDKAMDLQQKILNNNTVPKIIMGGEMSNAVDEKASKVLSFSLMSAFVTPNSHLGSSCVGWSNAKKPSTICDIKDYSGDLVIFERGSYQYDNPNAQLDYVVENKDTTIMFDNLLRLKNGETFAFDYQFIISSAAGVFAILLLLNFCFDIAVRTVKLNFYRLIAPIPIISYVDPIKGESVLKKWLSEVGKTYADLFIRLIAIFFSIYIIQHIAEFRMDDLNGNRIQNPFVFVFIILGALMFAKQFPKLLQDILGINLSGKMQLNPLKNIRENALGGKVVVAGAGGIASAGIAGTRNLLAQGVNIGKNIKENGFKKGWRNSGGIHKFLGSGIGGAMSGLVHGSAAAYRDNKILSAGKGVTTAVNNKNKRDAKNAMRDERIRDEKGLSPDDKITFADKMHDRIQTSAVGAKVQNALTGESKYQSMDRQIKNRESVVSTLDSIKKETDDAIFIKSNLYTKVDSNDSDATKRAKAHFRTTADTAINLKNKHEALQKVDVEALRRETKKDYIQKQSEAIKEADEFSSIYGIEINATTTDDEINDIFGDSDSLKEQAKAMRQNYIDYSKSADQVADEKVEEHMKNINTAKDEAYVAQVAAEAEFQQMLKAGNIQNASISAKLHTIERTVQSDSSFTKEDAEVITQGDWKSISDKVKEFENTANQVKMSVEYERAEIAHNNAKIPEKKE